MYISTKNENNEWEKAKNLGAHINSNKMDYCPYIDFINNTLYFTSKRNNVQTSFKTKQSLNQILNISLSVKRFLEYVKYAGLVGFLDGPHTYLTVGPINKKGQNNQTQTQID